MPFNDDTQILFGLETPSIAGRPGLQDTLLLFPGPLSWNSQATTGERPRTYLCIIYLRFALSLDIDIFFMFLCFFMRGFIGRGVMKIDHERESPRGGKGPWGRGEHGGHCRPMDLQSVRSVDRAVGWFRGVVKGAEPRREKNLDRLERETLGRRRRCLRCLWSIHDGGGDNAKIDMPPLPFWNSGHPFS